MKTTIFSAFLALPLLASAVDLSSLTDLSFAERYAFSSERAKLIATLQPETPAWYVYSILNAQTSGDLKAADRLITQWSKGDLDFKSANQVADFRLRQALLTFDASEPGAVTRLANALRRAGVNPAAPARETPLAPNTYPSVLDPAKISFAAFWDQASLSPARDLDRSFTFLLLLNDPALSHRAGWSFDPNRTDILPDAPGCYEAIVAWLKDPANTDRGFRAEGLFKEMTLDQLERLGRELKGSPQDLYGNAAYATVVLSKLGRGADESFLYNPAAERALLEKRVAFTDLLKPSLAAVRLEAYRALLQYGIDHGEEARFLTAFKTYLGLRYEERPRADRTALTCEDAIIRAYLVAAWRTGADVSEIVPRIEKHAYARLKAETDLLAGRPIGEAGAQVLSPSEYSRLQERVDLVWAKTNPAVFAADDDVTLTLDVKNVKKMRLAVYALDPFEACSTLGGDVKSDIDLDGAVPTLERTVDYSRHAAIVRHTETLALPELKSAGLYVVECSGAGVCSRALVRKGRLRAVERRDAAGHVFTALDEKGAVVKGTKLRLGETVFTADENGEIAVPFAGDPKSAGRKVAVVGDGRLATTVAFDQAAESASLALTAVAPSEVFVAGRKATLLVRPELKVAGTLAPLELVKDPQLTLTFVDRDGNTTVRKEPSFRLSDTEESVVTFTVPERLAAVRLDLTGKLREAVTGKDADLSASATRAINGIASTTAVRQPFLRRGAKGYRLELRGRNGEPLAAQAVKLMFGHVAFKTAMTVELQTDHEGAVELGALTDIERVTLIDSTSRSTWSLEQDAAILPSVLTAAEGETIALPIRNLLAGGWPGANSLEVRVSLLEKNAAGEIVANRLNACSYTDGVLRIDGLPAGDYRLELRDRNQGCDIAVAKTAAGLAEGGVIASAARSLTDLGSPSRLRIATTAVSSNGVLTVQLAQATPETRVHVFATRTCDNLFEGSDLYAAFARTLERPEVRLGTWAGLRTDYVSGRDLGEKLRYVLDRRDQPHRVGNLLDRPSLLLNPWSVAETETRDVNLRDGNGWEAVPEEDCLAADEAWRSVYGAAAYGDRLPGGLAFTRDFLPQAATVIANLKPDEDGRIVCDLTKAPEVGLRGQFFTVLATDGRMLDKVDLVGACQPFEPTDRRFVAGRAAEPDRVLSRTYATLADCQDLLASLADEGFAESFPFLSRWSTLDEAAKRALYDTYASHELDVFLSEQDRAFFEAVVVPHLVNKRRKTFVDACLLGEDISAFVDETTCCETLNAFELCLLAKRRPDLAPKIAARFEAIVAANPLSPEDEDRLYAIALAREGDGEAQGDSLGDACDVKAVGKIVACQEACQSPQPVVMRSMTGSRSSGRVAKRRESRQLYRPPERTREWVETDYYRRRKNETRASLVSVNAFWRDYVHAIIEGKTATFASPNLVQVTDGSTAAVLALAVTHGPVVVSRPPRAAQAKLQTVHHFRDPRRTRANGKPGVEVNDEFVKGLVYERVTVVTNPTEDDCREEVLVEIPNGALPLGAARASDRKTVALSPYSVRTLVTPFYFPSEDLPAADGQAPALPVVAVPSQTDVTSWAYVSQNGTKGEVLAFLRERNLEGEDVDLSKIVWRLKDGAYARQVADVLASRCHYDRNIWLSGLVWRDAFDAARVREALTVEARAGKLARQAGPVLDAPLLTIEPERTDLFEHKEYWPIINAYAHAIGGKARPANKQLEAQYRAFLDVLAAKKVLSDDDRLLAAVYLIAQDRIEEAKTQVAACAPDSVETRLQLAYLKAYLAFCDGDVAKARTLAAPYAGHPVAHWRQKFAEVIAQADEIEGKAAPTGDAATAPTLALAQEGETLCVTGANLDTCVLKVYPTDVEILFSKQPFGEAASARERIRCLRPAWTREVTLAGAETRVKLPDNLRAKSLVVVASGGDGRAEARLEMVPRSLDVQVSREYRRLRVRAADGKAVAGAYVKVYARRGATGEVVFHKDGYTDLRGVFDYAAVSTETAFKPDEYAILVLDEVAGAKTLTVKE